MMPALTRIGRRGNPDTERQAMYGLWGWGCMGALCALLGTASQPRAEPAGFSPARLDRVVDSAAARGFSGHVLVGAIPAAGTSAATPPAVLYERVVGLADRARRRPIRADDAWRWASVTKQVTAALVMQQVDSGRIALDEPVTRYLPDFAGPTGSAVTVRQLLQHTSGLPNPSDTPRDAGMPAFYLGRGPGVGNAAATRGYCATTPKRAPGASFEYNNCDYLVLGAILERVTRRPYASLVRAGIAVPLGLHSLRVAGAPRDGAPVLGYEEDGRPEPAFNLATFGAAGALSGTARDLLAFDHALAGHRLVSPSSTAEMWRSDPRLGYAALGAWSFPATLRGCAGAVRLIERRGAIGGIQVRNVIAPERGRALIVFTNSAAVEFGEIWQGAGLSHDLLSAALCDDPA
jgi:CubicO group peptidase (beta-lactamase class C family)